MRSRIRLVGYFIYDHPFLSAGIVAAIAGGIYFGYRLAIAIGVVMEFGR